MMSECDPLHPIQYMAIRRKFSRGEQKPILFTLSLVAHVFCLFSLFFLISDAAKVSDWDQGC